MISYGMILRRPVTNFSRFKNVGWTILSWRQASIKQPKRLLNSLKLHGLGNVYFSIQVCAFISKSRVCSLET